MGVFIEITVDETRIGSEVAPALVQRCPVDIFALDRKRLIVRGDQEDECTLCELCLSVAPAGALTIRKTYKDEQLVSRGGEAPDQAS